MSSSVMSVDEQYALITRNLQEVLDEKSLRELLQKRQEEEKPVVVYWGTAPTGRPHIGYFIPMSKLADFLNAGCVVKILIADLHALLDNQKTPLALLDKRSEYYEAAIKAMLKSISVPIEKLMFVRGRSFQLREDYTLDAYKLSSMVTVGQAQKAGTEVVKQTSSPPLSGLLYPGLQALDEEYLGVDVQFGGNDQRKIFVYAKECLPKLGYKKRIHLMNPMVENLEGSKMSASDGGSKIDLLDSRESVAAKIKSAFCEAGNTEKNGPLTFCKLVLFPLRPQGLEIQRKEEHGGNVVFKTPGELTEAFKNKEIHPGDLKKATEMYLNELMEPVRREFNSPALRDLVKAAYPDQAAQVVDGVALNH